MIILRIFLGIIWSILFLVYCILCGVHIREFKGMRFVILGFIGGCLFFSFFAFPIIVFLILTVLEAVLYLVWEYKNSHHRVKKFRPNKLQKMLFSWVYISNEDVIINLIFPKPLTYLIIFIVSAIKPDFKGLLKAGGTEIEIDGEEGYINIYI